MDSHNYKMPGRQTKRKSTDRIYKTVPNLKQSRIGLSPSRTIRDRHPTWSAPIMRQQSITQMDVLRDYYHPEHQNEDLMTDDEGKDSYLASPTRNKRQKVALEKPQPCRIETRSAKRQTAEEEPASQAKKEQNDPSNPRGEAESQVSRPRMPTAMLPPKTPMSSRRKEIPSSQSPADTPLSVHSRHSLQDFTRSPLKERSTNMNVPIKSPQRGAARSKRLEVADSMETEDEDSPISVKVGLTIEAVGPTAEPEDMRENEPLISSNPSAVHVNDFNQRLKAAQRPVQEIQSSSQARLRREVIDSTDEEDDEAVGGFDVGRETQAALASTDVSQKSTNANRPAESTPPITKPAEEAPELGAIEGTAPPLPEPPNAPSPPTKESKLEDRLQIQEPKKVDFNNLASSDPSEPTEPSHLSSRPSAAEDVSAKLLANLHRDTQPGGLQTESQYEKGWTTYTPADDTDMDIHSDDLEPPSSSLDPKPMIEESQPSPDHLLTVPTQFIRPAFSSPPKFYKATPLPLPVPVPPSQATTVDVTQPSPSSYKLAATPSSSTQLPPPPPPTSSPPPPIPPPSSSSPAKAAAADPWEGYVWDGRRLTDSQLLPDGLLDDSQGGLLPPLEEGSQENWGQEGEV